jgi:hypothetical protein
MKKEGKTAPTNNETKKQKENEDSFSSLSGTGGAGTLAAG